MNLHKSIGGLLALATIFMLSCDVATLIAPQQVPTSVPGLVNTIVALTAGAASTQTALHTTPSLTSTFTPFPTKTPTETPTPTATFFFQLPTLTPTLTSTRTPAPTGSGGSSGSSGSKGGGNLECKLLRMQPVNGKTVTANASFTTVWTVKNIGDTTWDSKSTDYIYISGDHLGKVDAYDIYSPIPPGSKLEMQVDMKAPGSSGTYATTWGVRSGKTTFCHVSITIAVP